MKKFIRKLTALTLALCLVCACAITVSAGSIYDSGTYNGQGYGTYDRCSTIEVYSETNTSSSYLVKAKAGFYYERTLEPEYGGYVESDYCQTTATTRFASNQTIAYMGGFHYVDYTLVSTQIVYP